MGSIGSAMWRRVGDVREKGRWPQFPMVQYPMAYLVFMLFQAVSREVFILEGSVVGNTFFVVVNEELSGYPAVTKRLSVAVKSIHAEYR